MKLYHVVRVAPLFIFEGEITIGVIHRQAQSMVLL